MVTNRLPGTTKPELQRLRPGRPNWKFLGIAAGNFLVLLDASILNVALPNIQQNLHAAQSTLPWAADAYTVVFAGLLLAAGAAADRWGARRLYRAGLWAFGGLSLLCAAAPTIGLLIGGRALLGIAAACMVPSSLALLAGLYPDPKKRAQAIGVWAAVTSAGLLCGPLFGGILVSAGGWRLVFLVTPPVALLALLASRHLITAPPTRQKRVDIPGLILSVLALSSLAYGLIAGGTSGWNHPTPIVAVLIGLLAFTALIQVEKKAVAPALPPALLRMPRVRADLIAGGVATMVFYGILYSLTLWLQIDRGLTPLQTGLAFIPMTLPMCVLPMVTGRIVGKFGARPVIMFGLAADVLAGALLIAAGPHGSLGWIIAAEVALVAASTTAIPAATADMAAAAPPHLLGTGQGAFNAARQAGTALGVALLGPLMNLRSAGIILAITAAMAVIAVQAAHRRRRLPDPT